MQYKFLGLMIQPDQGHYQISNMLPRDIATSVEFKYSFVEVCVVSIVFEVYKQSYNVVNFFLSELFLLKNFKVHETYHSTMYKTLKFFYYLCSVTLQ